MQVRHSGLIIRETDVGESDRIVTILTADNGLIRAFARGSKKIKSKLFSSTRIFTYGDFMLQKGKDKYIVTDAVRKSGFFSRIDDIKKLALAQYVCEFCSLSVPQEEPDGRGEILRLALNTLYAIEKTDKPLYIIKPAFELRMLSLLGYCPDVSGCGDCGSDEGELTFYFEEGVFLCDECKIYSPACVKIDGTTLAAMRYVVSCELEKVFSFTVPEAVGEKLSYVAEKYAFTQLERDFRTLDFYHSV